jgi:hypothetical protein
MTVESSKPKITSRVSISQLGTLRGWPLLAPNSNPTTGSPLYHHHHSISIIILALLSSSPSRRPLGASLAARKNSHTTHAIMASHLLNDPQRIATLRRQLFELKSEIALTLADWQAIWPFIDNMWVERNASRSKERQQFNCRIWRNDSDKKAGAGRRNRVRRDVEPCSMKMYVVRKDGGVLVSRCPGRTNDVSEHNHDMGYLDKVKTPSAVMRIAADVMGREGKTPSEAVKNLKGLPVVQALEQDGGLYIDSNRVRNAHKALQHTGTNGTTTAVQRRSFMADAGASVDGDGDVSALQIDSATAGAGLPVSCQCGTVRFTTPFAKPIALYHCHCLECQKQSATAFGTSALYPADFLFPLSDVLQEHLTLYSRTSKSGGTVDCYFCKTCGSRMFHRIVDADGTPRSTVSIKGGVIEGLSWEGGIHIWTSRAVVAVPSNAEKWRESPEAMPARPVAAHEDTPPVPAASALSNGMVGAEVPKKDMVLDPAINPDLPAFPYP